MYSSYDLENLAREQYARLVREAEQVRLARRAGAERRRSRLASLMLLDRLRSALRDRRSIDAPLEVSVEEAR